MGSQTGSLLRSPRTLPLLPLLLLLLLLLRLRQKYQRVAAVIRTRIRRESPMRSARSVSRTRPGGHAVPPVLMVSPCALETQAHACLSELGLKRGLFVRVIGFEVRSPFEHFLCRIRSPLHK